MPVLNKSILLRVTEREREQIATNAGQRRMSVNDYLRSVALGLPTQDKMELEARIERLESRMHALETGGAR